MEKEKVKIDRDTTGLPSIENRVHLCTNIESSLSEQL